MADALKHCVLTHRVAARQVSTTDEVLVVATNYGAMGYGMGKFGGTDQVVVLAKRGSRPKARAMAETGKPFVRVRQLFAGKFDDPMRG